MKVALVHDYIKEYGGAERVLEALHELYPDAPIFTSVYLPDYLGPHKKRFIGWDIHTSFLEYLPFKAKLISPIRLIAPLVFPIFDFSKYDVVIVSATGAYNPNMINKKSAVQICYCHTPPRYLYGFATAREWKKNFVLRVFGEIANHFLRLIDFASSKNVDFFIANSDNVKARIKKFYRKDATVIYPPVEIPRSKSQEANKSQKTYYLAGGRLARPKHIDLIVKTCVQYNLPLKVFGKGFAGYENELRIMKQELRKKTDHNSSSMIHDSPIEFLGEVTDQEKLELMKNARAYIFAAEDEDFGITPVEAMSVGTPVIAYRSGGVVESVFAGKTGLFFDKLTVESLKKAIEQLEKIPIDPKACREQAEKFSKARFKAKIRDFVSSKLKSQNENLQLKS